MFNKKILIASAAIIVSSSIGIPVAVTVVANSSPNSKAIYTANAVTSSDSAQINDVLEKTYALTDSAVSSSAVSSPISSTPSSTASTPSSTPSSAPASSAVTSSTPTSSTASTVTPVDNTAARNAALAIENTRHDNVLTATNNLYDPQISALQTEIGKFQSENARDTTAEIAFAQAEYDKYSNAYDAAHTKWYNDKYELSADKDTIANDENMMNLESASAESAGKKLTDLKTSHDQLLQDYNKMLQDQSQLPNLQSQKQSAIDSETADHNSRIAQIYAMYP